MLKISKSKEAELIAVVAESKLIKWIWEQK
jgi:hypothetical protein